MARKRSIGRALLKAAAVLVVLVLMAGIWLWWLGGGMPQVKVDYAAELNKAALAVPEEDRAWPIYIEAVSKLPKLKERAAFDDLISSAAPGGERWTEAVRALDEYAEVVALIREGAAKAAAGVIAEPEVSKDILEAEGRGDEYEPYTGPNPAWVVDVVLPQLSEFRSMTRILRVDALHAAEVGDGDRITADIEAMAGLGRQAREQPILINALVAQAIGVAAAQATERIIHDNADVLGEAQLARIDHALMSAFTGPGTTLDLTGERYFFLDVIQRLYSDDGQGNGRITAKGLEDFNTKNLVFDQKPAMPHSRVLAGFMSLFSMDRAALTAMVNGFYDELEAYAARSPWARGPDTFDVRIETMHANGNPLDMGERLVSLLMPALSSAVHRTDESRTEVEAARLLIALDRFRLAHGTWPASPDELVPTLIDHVPLDPFTGDPLKYMLTDAGPVIYSVGVDREDDGGRPSAHANRWRPVDQVQSIPADDPDGIGGDWVLYPAPDDG
ncbi:MAG: hypothetical protein H6810_13125 [Phycisphaeraceae bacterium]|nr:MAG: hypothetical protein H6810_13125 [Phycisphaeraceae bacterium]